VSIACVGGIIGFGAEEVSFRRAAVGDDAAFGQTVGASVPQGPTAAERALIQRATEGLPPYKDAVPQPLAADFLGERAPIAAAWFRTQDSAKEVLDFYEGTFTDAGIPMVGAYTGPSSGYVGYLNPRTHEVHLITVVAEGGQTMVFPSVGNVEGLKGGSATFPEGVPHPAGASAPLVLTFHREGEVEVTMAAKVGKETLRELVAFYRDAFPAQGWSLTAVREEKDQATLEASRGDSKLTTLLRRRSPDEVELYLRLVGPA
jgi:hypothetical protein